MVATIEIIQQLSYYDVNILYTNAITINSSSLESSNKTINSKRTISRSAYYVYFILHICLVTGKFC